MNKNDNFDKLHGIERGKHFYQFYKAKEDFFQVMIPYFQAGLYKGEACIWVVSNRIGLLTARQIAHSSIPRFAHYLNSGQMSMYSAEEWYLTDGRFDEEKSMQNFADFVERAKELDFDFIRGAGDAGCIQKEDWPKLYEYERKADPMIKTTQTIALCAYPIVDCTPSHAKSVLELHEDVLMGHF